MPGLFIELIVILIVVGIVWWCINSIPLPPPADWIVRVVFGLIVALFILSLFLSGGSSWPAFHGFGRRC